MPKKRKAWELLQVAVKASDHTNDCAIEDPENEDRDTDCTCWVGEAAALLERKAKKTKKAGSGDQPSQQEEVLAKWTVIAKLKRLHELMPEEIPWPDYDVGSYVLRTGINGRPEAHGIPKDDDDETGYRDVELSSTIMNAHWNLYLSFPYPTKGPGAKWGEISKPNDLTWAQINREVSLWVLKIRDEVDRWIERSRGWQKVSSELSSVSFIQAPPPEKKR